MTDAPDAPDPVDAPDPDPADRPLPARSDDGTDPPGFDAPWQARAFGIAVALADEGGEDGRYDWTAFQSRLIEEIGGAADAGEVHDPDAASDPGAVEERYYRQWLTVLERLLDERGLVDREAIAERAAEFAAGDRDASEFVAGDR